MKLTLLTSLLLLAASSAVADSITVVAPENGARVSGLKCAQRMFAALPEDVLKPLMADTTFSSDMPQNVTSFPAGVLCDWIFKGDRKNIFYRLTFADNPELTNPIVIKPGHSRWQFFNLIPGKTYFWKVEAVYKDGHVLDIPVQSFSLANEQPRILNVPGVDNCRDLGGWTGLDGRTVAYSKIFRNTGLNSNSKDGKIPGPPRFTPEGRDILKNTLKIKTELDLRTLWETAAMKQSPLGPDVAYINISSLAYANLYTQEGRENYARLFRIFCNEDNYPIDFHCIAGADRTGTLAFVLLTVLGVPMDNVAKDYVFTSFYSLRTYATFNTLRYGLDAYGNDDEPSVLKMERFLLHAGITPEEIIAFRDIMLGKGTTQSHVLKQHRILRKAIDESSREPNADIALTIKMIPKESTVIAGKNVATRDIKDWRGSSCIAYGDGRGGSRFLLHSFTGRENVTVMPVIGESMQKKLFTVTELLSKTVFTNDEGKDILNGSEVASLSFPPKRDVMFIQITPADNAPNADWKRVKANFKPKFNVLETAVISPNPVIDGTPEEREWQNIPAFRLASTLDTKAFSRNTVKFAYDKDCSILYIAADFKDSSPIVNAKKHDDAVYNDDCCEIFLTSQDNPAFFQLAINRDGTLYDGLGKNAAWNIRDFSVKTAHSADGWTLEAAIPLAQFAFTAPLNLNITYSDYPATARFNLIPTGNSFHNRHAMLPVVLK